MLRLTRVALGGALSAALVMAALSSQAAPPAERELLGVRIWRDYAAVLKRHGEPTRVVPGIALPPEVGVGSVNVSMQTGQAGRMSMPGGAMMGPSMGLSGPPGMPMMGGMMSAGGAGRGMPMMGGPGGLAMGGGRSMPMVGGGRSMPMAGGGRLGGQKSEDEDDIGSGSPVAGMSGAPRGASGGGPGGAAGFSAPPSYAGGSAYGSSMMMSPPMMGGMSGPPLGMGGTSPSVSAQSQAPVSIPSEDVKETWVYVKGGHTFQFLFNRDGRIIRIQSFGAKRSGATSRSIGLGDPLSKVYAKYGWAGSTVKQGDSVTLDYSQKAHVVFDLANRHDGKGLRVVGITVAPSEGRR